MKNYSLAVVLTLPVLIVLGCSSQVNRVAIVDQIRQTDTQVIKFFANFPEAGITLDTSRGFGELFPDARNQEVSVRQELSDGYSIEMERILRVESDGVTFDRANGDENWRYYLLAPTVGSLPLSQSAFDAIVAARGDLSSLKPFGIDFSLSPMNEEKVIEGVLRQSPVAATLRGTFPETCYTRIDKPAYSQAGEFCSTVTLADGNQLSVHHAIRVGVDGHTVRLADHDTMVPHAGRMVLYVADSGWPGGSSMDLASPHTMELSSEQFERILAAKGAPRVVQQLWSERLLNQQPITPAHDGRGRDDGFGNR